MILDLVWVLYKVYFFSDIESRVDGRFNSLSIVVAIYFGWTSICIRYVKMIPNYKNVCVIM